MAITVTVKTSSTDGGNSVGGTTTHVGTSTIYVDEDIADAASDLEIAISFAIGELKTYEMVADGALTIRTNSPGTPQEVFVLSAGKSVLFREGDTAIFAGDITAFFATNSSGASVNLTILLLIDATP